MSVAAPQRPHPRHGEGAGARDGSDLLGARLSTTRRYKDRIATAFVWASVVAAVVPLALVLVLVVKNGIGAMRLEFFTANIPTTRSNSVGMGPAIVGTVIITLAATLMAVPLGILAAIYLNEYGGQRRVASAVRFLANVMTGVPSIVMGLFVYTIWVLEFGQSAFAGALALACLMLPVVIRSGEEMLRLVPDDLRAGSLALGTRKSRMILTVVLPSALPGLTSGSLLAVARAAGETAPLLFTIGALQTFNPNLFGGTNTALPIQIYNGALSPFAGAHLRAWGAALTLIVIVLAFTVVARVVTARFSASRHR